MKKFSLYIFVLAAFIPALSFGSLKPNVQKNFSDIEVPKPFLMDHAGLNDSLKLVMVSIPYQDSTGARKKIKEVAKAKPKAIPEKIARRPADPGETRRPGVQPGRGKEGARPAGGPGRPGGAGATRPQSQPRRGR